MLKNLFKIKIFIILLFAFALGILLGISIIKLNTKITSTTTNNIQKTTQTVTGTITLLTGSYNKVQELIPIDDVDLVILDQDGKILTTVRTRNVRGTSGIASLTLTVPIDKRFSIIPEKEEPKKGSVTVVSFKEGYTETVIFDVGIFDNFENKQIVPLMLLNEEGRDQPQAILGYLHRLSIAAFIDDVARLTGLKVYGRY